MWYCLECKRFCESVTADLEGITTDGDRSPEQLREDAKESLEIVNVLCENIIERKGFGKDVCWSENTEWREVL